MHACMKTMSSLTFWASNKCIIHEGKVMHQTLPLTTVVTKAKSAGGYPHLDNVGDMALYGGLTM